MVCHATATDQLKFKVTGEGTYRAACNGDATSREMLHQPTMKLFSGKLVVFVQPTQKTGSMQLVVSGDGIENGIVTIKTEELKN
jgi:beta-galactosidase